MDAVQRELRDTPGVTVLVYDQPCAAEKRRRRRRGTVPAAAQRVFINERVCEGCGDCGAVSSCVAVRPVETSFGVKRRIDQSACNADLSCLEGFCPSFVTVEGAAPIERKLKTPADDLLAGLPEPQTQARPGQSPYGLLLTGIGGTGVVTVSAILGTAAHLEGRGVRVLDVTGVAQKNGAVTCHLQWAETDDALHAARLGKGRVDLVLACDAVVAASGEVRALIDPAATAVVANGDIQATAAATFDPEAGDLARETRDAVSASAERVEWLPVGRVAQALCGDSIYGNIMQLGYAVQRGLVPLDRRSVERAIELNNVAVGHNLTAFAWGRLAAADPDAVMAAAGVAQAAPDPAPDLDGLIADRRAFLTAYQDARLADRYLALVRTVRAAEHKVSGGEALTEAVARNYAKLLAYKDEYEVARLYSDGTFRQALADQFGDVRRVKVWLAPPLLAARDPETGRLIKRAYGPWMLTAMTVLAKLRRLRGSRLDPFGRTAERRRERRLIAEYEAMIERIATTLSMDNLDVAVTLAGLPDSVRGYGHVKDASMDRYEFRAQALMREFSERSSGGAKSQHERAPGDPVAALSGTA